MPEELSDEQKKLLADQQEEAAYGKFKGWLDRYVEENKPAPDKTDKGAGSGGGVSLFGTLFGGK